MCPHELPESDGRSRWYLPPEQTWTFAKWFGVIAFFTVGSVVFYSGFRQFRPGPLPPGAAYCGNAIIGGLILMVVGAPVAAVVSSLVAAAIGAFFDYVRTDFRT
jgi:hypothetical protein